MIYYGADLQRAVSFYKKVNTLPAFLFVYSKCPICGEAGKPNMFDLVMALYNTFHGNEIMTAAFPGTLFGNGSITVSISCLSGAHHDKRMAFVGIQIRSEASETS